MALLAGTLDMAAPALAADTPFTQRFAQTTRGSIEAVGNQLLTCPAAAAGCTNARARTGSTDTMNNNYNMGYVDVDSDATTVNSSTATLTLPAGATVLWAGLYWGADTSAGTGGSAAPNAANRGTVKFKVGSGAYQNVTAAAADVISSTGRATRYRAFADVSSQVTAGATYTVADVQTGRGDDRYAGWALLVAYQDASQDVHRVSVYDGLGTVESGVTFSTNIAPFFTPSSGTVDTRVGMLAFEGDAGIAVGESQTFNGSSLVDAQNPVDNPLNSTASINGTAFSAKNPNYSNLMGTDIDVSDRTGLLAHNQGSAVLSYASGQDLFVPSALWLVSDEGPAVNASGPTVGGIARDGSRQVKKPRTIGFMRVFVAGQSGRKRYSLKLAKKGKKSALVAGAGKPTVMLKGAGVSVTGLPERTAVVELTMYRVKKLDGNTKRRVYKLRARVAPAGGTLSVRPKAPR